MRKILIYFAGFIILFFVIPAICTITPEKQETLAQTEQLEQTEQNEVEVLSSEPQPTGEKYDYKTYKTIKLLHTSSNQVEELNIDEYLYGVVSSEMPASFETEALKAQAVVARTYTIYQITNNPNRHENADMCDDFGCCQAWISKEERIAKWESDKAVDYWNKIVEAVNATQGKIVTYDSKPINAFFHANSGGITESSLNIWSGIDYPYLKSVETSGEDTYTQYASEVVLSHQELLNKMRSQYDDCEINFEEENCIQILEYTSSGRVKTIKFGNKEIAGTEARTLIGLKSTKFTFAVNGEKVTFTVTGYGHGVGMSQTGADALAKTGSNYEGIIKHFYAEVEIKEVNSL